jgi:hypothetical protein
MAIWSVVLASYLLAGEAVAASPAEKPMQCVTGPIHRVFGGTKWLVYSCDDLNSMVVLSEEGNPASPFYFLLHKQGDAYEISGEGNGDRAASDAAGNEISAMSAAQLADLLAATKVKPH